MLYRDRKLLNLHRHAVPTEFMRSRDQLLRGLRLRGRRLLLRLAKLRLCKRRLCERRRRLRLRLLGSARRRKIRILEMARRVAAPPHTKVSHDTQVGSAGSQRKRTACGTARGPACTSCS